MRAKPGKARTALYHVHIHVPARPFLRSEMRPKPSPDQILALKRIGMLNSSALSRLSMAAGIAGACTGLAFAGATAASPDSAAYRSRP